MYYIKEYDLLREVVLALQGINGHMIRQNDKGIFTITKEYEPRIDPVQRMLVEKLTSFGWLVKKIKYYVETVSPEQGKVSQSLASALNAELLDYYEMVTNIDRELKCANQDIGRTRASTPTSELYACVGMRPGPKPSATYESLQTIAATNGNSSPNENPLTLLQVHVKSFDHFFRLKMLAALVHCCQRERGGHLARTVYKFAQHGDKQIRAMILRIMKKIIEPIRRMLIQWILYGEIMEPRDEFFICLQDDLESSFISSFSHNDRQRSEDYVLNHDMMPGFISEQQANKILALGNAMRLLRHVCSIEATNIESLTKLREHVNSDDIDDKFDQLLKTAYEDVSRRALESLFVNYKLRSHFKYFRQYLLLGQGDFIRHLMDLLHEEFDKPVAMHRFKDMTRELLRAKDNTNAKFDATDKLNYALVDTNCESATGWDIFTLTYRVDGPIRSVFTPEIMRDYVYISRQLWRYKRVEHVLTSLWSQQMYYSKVAKSVLYLKPVFHKANVLLTEMIHFMQHHQNYIFFEVVECSWSELLTATDVAKGIDDVKAAHESYLKKIKSGTCQKDTQMLECVFKFQNLMSSLFELFESDLGSVSEVEQRRISSNYLTEIQALCNSFRVSQK